MDEKPTFQHPQPQSNQPAQDQIAGIDTVEEQQIASLQQGFGQMENKRVNLNTDIIGLFETVTIAPTLTPKSPYDQIKISVISGTTALNVYDATNHVWKKVTLT